MRHSLEASITNVSNNGDLIVLRVIEVGHVEHHVSQAPPPPGWTVHENGLVATGPVYVVAGIVDVTLDVDAAQSVVDNLTLALRIQRGELQEDGSPLPGMNGAGPG